MRFHEILFQTYAENFFRPLSISKQKSSALFTDPIFSEGFGKQHNRFLNFPCCFELAVVVFYALSLFFQEKIHLYYEEKYFSLLISKNNSVCLNLYHALSFPQCSFLTENLINYSNKIHTITVDDSTTA